MRDNENKTFQKLEELLQQEQFELLFPGQGGDIRLVYLMNDAVESFLVFQNGKMTGNYLENYEEELMYSLSRDGEKYVLVVHQGGNVVTLFFDDLVLETYLYDYGEVGHFWVQGYEYLRLLEYRIAILRDKYEYLGKEFCSSLEQKLSALADFPPLNYCSYPSVPQKYIVPREEAEIPSEKALDVMTELAEAAKDKRLLRMLKLYQRFPGRFLTRSIAGMLHRNAHRAVIDLLTEKLRTAAGDYPERVFDKELNERCERIKKAVQRRKKELECMGKRAVMIREEPFVAARDSIEFKMYLMIWKRGIINRKVEVEEYELL